MEYELCLYYEIIVKKSFNNLLGLLVFNMVLLRATTGCMDCPPIIIGGTLCTLPLFSPLFSTLGVPPIELQRGDWASNSWRSLVYALAISMLLAISAEALTRSEIAFSLHSCNEASSFLAWKLPLFLSLYWTKKKYLWYFFVEKILLKCAFL